MKLIMENWRKHLNEEITITVGRAKRTPTFAPCFQGKENVFKPLLGKTLEIIEAVINKDVDDWPQTIECMTEEEIKAGEEEGGGHGLYVGDEKKIKINQSMDPFNIYLNFIHENFHHARPDLAGPKYSSAHRHIEINESLMKQVVDHILFYINQSEEIEEQIPNSFILALEEYE